MIDPKLLKENLSAVSSNLKNKNYMLDKDEFLKVDSDRKELILENESLKNKKNLLSKEIGILKSNGEDSTEKTKAVEDPIAWSKHQLRSSRHQHQSPNQGRQLSGIE